MDKKFLLFFLVVLLAANVSAECLWWNPLTYLECLAPAGQFFAAPFAAFTGTFDSDLLLLSGSPIFMEGQNQPLQGNVVISNYVVGIGNDVAAIGNYDQESTTISALGDTATYFVSAKKVKNSTIIGLSGLTKTLRATNNSPDYSGTVSGYSVGNFLDEAQVQQSIMNQAAPAAYAACTSYFGGNLVAFAWRPIEQSDVTYPYSYHSICTTNPLAGYCFAGWTPQVYFDCWSFGSGQITFNEFGAKTVDVQVDVQLINNVSEQTTVLTLAQGDCGSNCRTSGYLSEGGVTVGYAELVGLTPSFQLPLDLTNEAPAIFGSSSRKIVSGSDARDAWNTLQTLQTVPTFSNWNGNYSGIETALNDYITKYNATYNSGKDRFSDRWTFSYNSSLNSYIVNDTYTSNPNLQVIVKGDWLGLIRDVADFELTCGPSVQGYEQTSATSYVIAHNTSNVSGSLNISWSCPTGNNSIQTQISANESKTFDVSFYIPSSGSGSCTINATWGDDQTSCPISYNFVPRPVSCGNGVCEPSIGENCSNCATDCGCNVSAGQVCVNSQCIQQSVCDPPCAAGFYCVVGQCVPIPIPSTFDWVLVGYIIAAILLAAGIGLIIYAYYRM